MSSGTILKPTLIDVDNETRFVRGKSSDHTCSNNNNNNNETKNDDDGDDNEDVDYDGEDDDGNNIVKECGTKWCFSEQRTRFFPLLYTSLNHFIT